jgi:hypothetical protein
MEATPRLKVKIFVASGEGDTFKGGNSSYTDLLYGDFYAPKSSL